MRAPRLPKTLDGPKIFQEASEMASRRPKRFQDGPRDPQDGPKEAQEIQEGLKTAKRRPHNGFRKRQTLPQITLRRPKGAREAPRRPLEAFKTRVSEAALQSPYALPLRAMGEGREAREGGGRREREEDDHEGNESHLDTMRKSASHVTALSILGAQSVARYDLRCAPEQLPPIVPGQRGGGTCSRQLSTDS